MDINHIIHQYFSRSFSLPTQRAFRWWMVNSEDKEVKEDVLRRIWDSMPAPPFGQDTFRDLVRTEDAIRKKRPRIRLLRFSAAAAVVLLCGLAAYGGYRLFTDHSGGNDMEIAQFTVPYGQRRTLSLNDGTRITMDAGSTIIYPEDMTAGRRSIFLLGQAYFVAGHASSQPLTVRTQDFVITDIGTRFAVTSWPESGQASAALEKGSIRVDLLTADGKLKGKNYDMKPDQLLVHDRATGKTTLTSSFDIAGVLAWKNGEIRFNGAAITDILPTLERHYGVRIHCEGIEKMRGFYRLRFRRTDRIRDALDVLHRIDRSFTYEIRGKDVFIQYLKNN